MQNPFLSFLSLIERLANWLGSQAAGAENAAVELRRRQASSFQAIKKDVLYRVSESRFLLDTSLKSYGWNIDIGNGRRRVTARGQVYMSPENRIFVVIFMRTGSQLMDTSDGEGYFQLYVPATYKEFRKWAEDNFEVDVYVDFFSLRRKRLPTPEPGMAMPPSQLTST